MCYQHCWACALCTAAAYLPLLYCLSLSFTLLCHRARALSEHAAQRDSCHAQSRARHHRVTVTAAAPRFAGFRTSAPLHAHTCHAFPCTSTRAHVRKFVFHTSSWPSSRAAEIPPPQLPLLPAPAVVVQLQSQVLVISIHHHAPLSAVTTDCRSRLARALYVTECASACNARRSCVKHDFD